MPVSINNTQVVFNDATTQTTAGYPNSNPSGFTSNTGTVTSVATGNGLQGGTITTSGTLSLAAPGFNTVGSYVLSWIFNNSGNVQGGTYAAGTGFNQVAIARLSVGDYGQNPTADASSGLSGTWRWMAGYNQAGLYSVGIACRVS